VAGRKIVVLATGGTIAGRGASHVAGHGASHVAGRGASHVAGRGASHVAGRGASHVAGHGASHVAGRAAGAADDLTYTAGEVGVHDLLQGIAVPEGCDVVAEQVAQVDSKDMDFDVWRRLALRCAHWLAEADVCGIVITHGSDTMEETAYFLREVLAAARPVVLTGAMRPATSLAPDGPRNLADALAVAAWPGARGVCVVFAGQIHDALPVTKAHANRLDAFGSGEAGILGTIAEDGVKMQRGWPDAEPSGRTGLLARIASAERWPRVEIVMNYAGAGGAIVDALVAQGVDGIVAAGTGNGTLDRALEEALLRAQQAGVKILRSTRCTGGAVIPHSGDRLPHSVLPPVKARIDLMLQWLK
jgi:L-asparaginase